MKSLRWRLTLWFAVSLLMVATVLVVSAHWHLDYELRKEKWERTHPAHPEWILHGSFTDKEVHDILGELVRFWVIVGVPVVAAALVTAYFLARHSTRPVRSLNQQLSRLGATTLHQRLGAPDADPEIAELVQHLNALLGRLETSFSHLQEYTSQVAHELRTPLQLMRLQVEANVAKMEPLLAEELQEELSRLSNYVETALTIARAEQGRLELVCEAIPVKEFLNDLLEPFSRLAQSERRRLLWSCPDQLVAWADRRALKQILFNLLSNALKHGREDILLRVRTRGERISFLLGNQLAEGATEREPGLGIGLRLVRAVVGQLEGVSVVVRRRTQFWVRLQVPIAPMPLAAHPTTIQTKLNRTQKEQIAYETQQSK